MYLDTFYHLRMRTTSSEGSCSRNIAFTYNDEELYNHLEQARLCSVIQRLKKAPVRVKNIVKSDDNLMFF